VYGLEHGVALAYVGASGGAHPSLELGRLIGEDVAIEVGENYDLEIAPALFIHQLGGHDINKPVIESDFGILGCHSFRRLQEFAVRGLDHIGLSHS